MHYYILGTSINLRVCLLQCRCKNVRGASEIKKRCSICQIEKRKEVLALPSASQHLSWASDWSCSRTVVSTVTTLDLTVNSLHIAAWGSPMPGGINSTLLSQAVTGKMSTCLDSSMVYSASYYLTAEALLFHFFVADERTLISLWDVGVHHIGLSSWHTVKVFDTPHPVRIWLWILTRLFNVCFKCITAKKSLFDLFC